MSSIEHLITVADLENYPDDDGNRYELIEGELFVSTAPGIPHQLILQNLLIAIHDYLKRNPIGKLVPGAGAVFSNFDAVIPDLVVVRRERWAEIVADNRFVAAPDLVIEIVSPGTSNRKRDLESKKRLYEKYGVEEYWIVDPENRCVMVYILQKNILEASGVYKTGDEVVSTVLPNLQVEVSTLFV